MTMAVVGDERENEWCEVDKNFKKKTCRHFPSGAYRRGVKSERARATLISSKTASALTLAEFARAHAHIFGPLARLEIRSSRYRRCRSTYARERAPLYRRSATQPPPRLASAADRQLQPSASSARIAVENTRARALGIEAARALKKNMFSFCSSGQKNLSDEPTRKERQTRAKTRRRRRRARSLRQQRKSAAVVAR